MCAKSRILETFAIILKNNAHQVFKEIYEILWPVYLIAKEVKSPKHISFLQPFLFGNYYRNFEVLARCILFN